MDARDTHAIHVGPRSREGAGVVFEARSPVDGSTLAALRAASPPDVDEVVAAAARAFRDLRRVPAPRRGEAVRRIGERLRAEKERLGELVSWEAGKVRAEALGEVQEMIDVCGFAQGLSRQLYGVTMGSERPDHRLVEQWHPLGPVGVITAFNFPVAVWAWNAALALACGDPVIWKPSEKAPLTALACHRLATEVLRDMPEFPEATLSVVIGGADVGARLAGAREVPLVSATGSVRMGRAVAEIVARRLGRSLLELGGNAGMIVAPSADLDLALRAIVFGAVGTAGQRCTSLRRLIVHESVKEVLLSRLIAVYERLPIGSPLDDRTLVGPLVDQDALDAFDRAISSARSSGGRLLVGGTRVTTGVPAGGIYVRPALIEISPAAPMVSEETFGPLLYVHGYTDFDHALSIHNGVPQGLSSAIFTNDLREAERFTSATGSDCGLANVNAGTSGAEIGGAFGGEKETGGGREAGSDAWKAYMRRMTSTLNFGGEMPLAQGVIFDV